jgi:hypothetical protein
MSSQTDAAPATASAEPPAFNLRGRRAVVTALGLRGVAGSERRAPAAVAVRAGCA